jgi:Tetratricopeptide repeat
MLSKRVSLGLFASLLSFLPVAHADVYQLIVQGKVVMQDGSPPPKPVGIQRICSDLLGSAPGPITNRKGEYLWRMDVDPMRTRVCHLEVNFPGYVSTQVDISGLDGYTKTAVNLPNIVLGLRSADPDTINDSESGVPGHSSSAWKAAMHAIDSGNLPEAENQLKQVVEASPKFERGWHTLGIIYENEVKLPEARDAYQHAIEADPKIVPPYVTLARACDRLKDWQCAANAADSEIKLDAKHLYPEIYLYQAVAQFGLKNLDAAKASAEQALQESTRPDQKKKAARAEFVLAKVYAAQGDYTAAREHGAKYLELAPQTPDADLIKAYLQVVGKPEGAGVDPDLVLP